MKTNFKDSVITALTYNIVYVAKDTSLKKLNETYKGKLGKKIEDLGNTLMIELKTKEDAVKTGQIYLTAPKELEDEYERLVREEIYEIIYKLVRNIQNA